MTMPLEYQLLLVLNVLKLDVIVERAKHGALVCDMRHPIVLGPVDFGGLWGHRHLAE